MSSNIELRLETLEQLINTPGLSGREYQVANIIRSHLPGDWQSHIDRLGNLIASPQLSGKKDCRSILLIAHMDEVGLIVRRITDRGLLLVERIGGPSIRCLPGSRLSLWTQDGYIPAQVGVTPQHVDNSSSITDLLKIYIDVGATSKAAAEAMGIQIGDSLTWDSPLQYLGEHRISGKAIDDRLGCFTLLMLARYIHENQISLDHNLNIAFITQEENMLMGGIPVVHALNPDIIIGIDGTLASDTPDVEELNSDIQLGNGPTLKLLDAIRGKLASYVPNWQMVDHIKTLSQQAGIPLQMEIVTGLSTAMSPLPYLSSGTATIGFSFPVRYHHSPVEMADLRDIKAMIRLLVFVLLSDLQM